MLRKNRINNLNKLKEKHDNDNDIIDNDNQKLFLTSDYMIPDGHVVTSYK